MQYYFLIFAAVVLLALQFSTNRAYELRRGSTAKASLFFSSMTGFASAAVCLVIALASGETVELTPFSLGMAALIAVCSCTYTFIGFKIMAFGSLSVFSMFLMLGGMLCPYLFGVFRLGEAVTPGRIIGVVLLAVSMVFPVISKNKSGRGGAVFFLLCAAVFLLNGSVSIVSKIHQVNTTWEVSSPAVFSFTANLINGVFSTIMFIMFTAAGKKSAVVGKDAPASVKASSGAKAVVFLVIANAACNGVSYTLQLISAGKVDASAMYPMMTGGSVVLSALAGLIFFGEKPDKVSLAGIVLAFAATFLFLF